MDFLRIFLTLIKKLFKFKHLDLNKLRPLHWRKIIPTHLTFDK